MNTEPSIPFYALVETVEGELCHARLLPPLSLEVVTNDWKQAKQRLLSRLAKHIRRKAPWRWDRPRPHSTPSHRVVQLEFQPPRNDEAWTQPLVVDVDMFSWTISGSNQQWLCPALDATLVTSESTVSDDFLRKQIKNFFARAHDEWGLEDVVDTFLNRKFRVRELACWTPRELSDLYAPKTEGPKKNSIAALRSVATRVVTWQHSPVYEQDTVISQLDDLLLCPAPQSVLLVGPPGVGKTAVVFAWAKRLEAESIKTDAENSKSDTPRDVWATSGARLVSGMTGLGMWQQRCHQVIKEAKNSRSILHLGSLVELMESGKINGQPGVASLIRSSIDRGRLLCIAECTQEQLAVVQREDPMLLRCFTKIEMVPTSEAATLSILAKVGQYLTDEKNFVPVTKRSNRRGANKAQETNPPITSSVTNIESAANTATSLFDAAAVDEVYRLHARFSSYSAMPGLPINFMRSLIESWTLNRKITDTDVAERFSRDTGLPLFLLNDLIPLDPAVVRRELGSNIIGQPEPVERLVKLITMLKARLNRSDRPLASLLLIGPTGVGKTETAKALARLLYRDHARMIRIDMSEYAQPWSAIRLIGSSREGDGTLTSPIRDQPFSVVLLDEFEKCHPSVLDLLLQLLGEGRLTDSAGRVADFRNAVIILTSNLGVDSYTGKSFGFNSNASDTYEHFLRVVRQHLRPELLGRIDQIIPFQSLPIEVVRQIADRELNEVSKRSGIRYQRIHWQVATDIRDLLAKNGYDPAYGARPLRREIERQIVIPLADAMTDIPTQSQAFSRESMIGFEIEHDASNGTNKIVPYVTFGDAGGEAAALANEETKLELESIRELRYCSELLIRSQPYQAIENSRERVLRQIARAEKQMNRLTSPRRIASAKKQLELFRQEYGQLCKTIDSIEQLKTEIETLHSESIMYWHSHDRVSPMPPLERISGLGNQLREQLIRIQKPVDPSRQIMTLILMSDHIRAARPLWQAYERISTIRQWPVSLFGLAAYDPNWDPLSKEYGDRCAAARKTIPIPKERDPAFRLLNPSTDTQERKKTIDVFRLHDWNSFESNIDEFNGFALEFRNEQATQWFGEEEGVHHFVGIVNEQTKRSRVRVLIYPGSLFNWDPPTNWNETPSMPNRDPRRTFYLDENRLASHLIGQELILAPDDPIAGWIEMIESESDSFLWQSIGYVPIPRIATMQSPVYPIWMTN